MGLERMAAVLQGTHDNYQIDLFKKLVDLSADITKTQINNDTIPSHRVISDHLRASCFLIADGLMPSNEGRGYVLRRIMRRAMRHANTLGSKDHVLSKMADYLIKEMSDEYSELDRAKELIKEVIVNEEDKFQSMLTNGMKIIHEEKNKIKDNILDGEIAFKLYDTYGFPLDLTEDYFKPLKIKVDTEKFNQLMDQRKVEARKSWKGSGSDSIEKIWFDLKEKYGATEFVGYNTDKTEAKIISLVKNNLEVKSVIEGEDIFIVTNQTCFYAESGGQVGDKGNIKTESGLFEVIDTQKFFNNLYVHIGRIKEGKINENQDALLEVNSNRKQKIKANHSATHLLHAALRETLGNHVAQKGSYVGPDRLRFDFSHSKQIDNNQLKNINDRVNYFIDRNDLVKTKIMSPEKAIKAGAMALFGEKYGDEVRVVSMGINDNNVYSLELCGGIHVNSTREIGKFLIISESSIASGIRRIEALRDEELQKYLEKKELDQKNKIQELENKFNKILKEIKLNGGKIENFKNFDEQKLLLASNYLKELKIKNILSDKNKNIINSISINNINFYSQILLEFPSKEIRTLVDEQKKKESTIVFIFSLDKEKTSIAVGVSNNLIDKFNASDLVKKLSSLLGGKGGGGRKDFAQAGGENASINDAQLALSKIIESIN